MKISVSSGSTPDTATNNGRLAQLVEQCLDKALVIGSNPISTTKHHGDFHDSVVPYTLKGLHRTLDEISERFYI